MRFNFAHLSGSFGLNGGDTLKLRVVVALLVAMIGSMSVFAVQQNPPPPIPAGPPVGSCCRTVLGDEGSSQQTTRDGISQWGCQIGSLAFHKAWNAGLLPYGILEQRQFVSPIGTWSAWFNSDGPGGNGDYELLKNLVDAKQVCATPLAIECQSVKDGIDWSKKPLAYHCDLAQGGYCVNKEQAAGKLCEDFKVRYLCSNLSTGSTQ